MNFKSNKHKYLLWKFQFRISRKSYLRLPISSFLPARNDIRTSFLYFVFRYFITAFCALRITLWKLTLVGMIYDLAVCMEYICGDYFISPSRGRLKPVASGLGAISRGQLSFEISLGNPSPLAASADVYHKCTAHVLTYEFLRGESVWPFQDSAFKYRS